LVPAPISFSLPQFSPFEDIYNDRAKTTAQ
jgi:hypothetical protein